MAIMRNAIFLEIAREEKEIVCLRMYKSCKFIYNTTPISGYHETNGSNKIAFHTLNEIPKNEPLTEHIICFDIEVEEHNFERAKSLANNTIAEFCCYLAVLLDVGFYEPTSKFVNFITTSGYGMSKEWKQERFRTAFFDPELNLYVKDNMNGLCTLTDLKNGNFNNGYYSLGSMDGINTVQMQMGSLSSIETTFNKHRLYKVKGHTSSVNEHGEDNINFNLHFLNEPICIPQKIRKYIRGIEQYKKDKYENFLIFRNACRLYNKSKTLSAEGASIEISFLVACLETLSKTKEHQNFSAFIIKYNTDANKDDLDALYSIRSKLFHSGNFSFFEFEYDVNPYSDPLYAEFRQKYLKFKIILRKAFITWVNENIIES